MTATELDRGVGSGMGRDTAVVTMCTLVSRVTGFGRVVATAAVLGSGLLGDVYQTANLIPNLLFELVAGGVLAGVLVPPFVLANRTGGREGLTAAVRSTTGVLLAALTAVALVGMALSPLLARLMVISEPLTGIRNDKLDVMVPMVLVFVPQLMCYGLAGVTSAALNARGRFVAAALAPAVNNVVVIGASVLFRASLHGMAASLDLNRAQFVIIAGGTTLGVLAFSLTPAVALQRDHIGWFPTWRPEHEAVQALRASFGWATLSIVGTLVPTGVALALGNGAPGGVAVFVYAFAFYVLPHALVAVPIATTLAPRVAQHVQEGEVEVAKRAVDSALRLAIPLLVLGTAGMMALAWPITRVAAIGQTASQGLAPIAHTLVAFGPGLPGYGIAFVMTRVLFAMNDVRRAAQLMIGGAVAGVLSMTLAAALMPASERATALALGYGLAQTVAAVLLTARVHRLTGAMAPRVVARIFAESVAAALVAAFAMTLLCRAFDHSRREAIEAVLLGGTAGVAGFAVAMALLRGGDLAAGRAHQTL